MQDDRTKPRPELPPLTDPAEVVSLLRAGDTLAHTLPDYWRLVRADVAVAAEVVPVLRGGGYLCGPRYGGHLVPLGDGLPGILRTGNALAQTYGWAEERSHATH